MEDTARSLTSSAKRFFSGTLLSRVTGFGREVLMALFFGTAPPVAAFWMAFRFAHLLRRIFGEGALHLAFVPHFETLRKESPEKASRFYYDLSLALTAFLVIIVAVVELILWKIHWSPENQEVVHLTQLLLPAIIPIVLYALNISFLNCQKSYFLPSAAPIALNFVWIVAVILLRHHPLVEAMGYLSIALCAAFFLQWVVTLPRTCQLLQIERGKATPWRELARLLRPFSLAVIGVTATQINTALDAIFARFATPEGPAYLWYALRLQQLPLALFGMATASALLPPLARAVQQGNGEKARELFQTAVKQATLWLIPITLGMVVCAPLLVKIVYMRGAFTLDAADQTSRCLQAYGVGLLPMTLVMIYAAPFYAKKQYMIPTVIGVAAVLLNIVLNGWFVFGLHWGAISVAFSTTISTMMNLGGLMIARQKERTA